MTARMETRARDIHEKLLWALWHLDCYRSERAGNEMRIYEPECRKVCYSPNAGLVVVAVSQDQLAPGRTAQFFHSAKSRAVLNACLDHRGVMAIEENGTLYFRISVEPVRERQLA